MVGLLLSTIGTLLVHQVRLVGARIDIRIMGLESTMDARFGGLEPRFGGLESTMDVRFGGLQSTMDVRFDAVDRRLDHLDRDVQAIAGVVFPRD